MSPPCPRLLLAPMAGFTNAVTRRIARRQGAAATYTEMVSAAGLSRGSERSWQLLELLPGEAPVVAHLYGSEPAAFATAAAAIEATGRFAGIDINAGCPVPRITHNGAGAALMQTPALLGKIVAAVHSASQLPVTVKTRLGIEPGRPLWPPLLAAIQEAGAAALTVHGRYLTQGHSGAVDFAEVERLCSSATLPLIGNGGICDLRSATTWLESGVTDLMIGQAALGNPWLFGNLATALATGVASTTPTSLAAIRALLEEHLADEVAHRAAIAQLYTLPPEARPPEEAAVITFRVHLFRYLRGLKGAAYARSQLARLTTLAEVHQVVAGCLAEEAAFRAGLSPAHDAHPPA